MSESVNKFEFTNESDYYVLLGNYDKVLSSWETKEEALLALENEKKKEEAKEEEDFFTAAHWVDLSVVGPEETIGGVLRRYIPDPESVNQRELASPSNMWADPSFLHAD